MILMAFGAYVLNNLVSGPSGIAPKEYVLFPQGSLDSIERSGEVCAFFYVR